MNGSREPSQRSGKGKGAAWAALVLSAGLAAVPAGAAWAGEAPDAGNQSAGSSDGQAAVASQQAGAQAGKMQAQAVQDGGQQGPAAQSDQQGGATQSASSSADQGTAAQQMPAASSDAGTYEQAGLHALTITYVDEQGVQIAPAHREALADGESYSVQSPAIGGYELADASQATIAGSVAKGSGDMSVTVTYRSTLVTYTVVHERQVGPKSSEYRVSETETLTAPSGTKVTAAPKSYDNYMCATDPKDFSAEVTPDGNTTIVIKYDVITPSYGVYFVTGGSYVAPQTGHAGDAVAQPANPVRAGYTFAGWGTDGDGVADTLPTAIPDHDVTATAVWTPATAEYQVQYYFEESGDEYGGEKHYELRDTQTLSGATESMTPATVRLDTSKGSDYQFYQYASETSAQIAGDGSTVVKVYYDLKPVTVLYFVLFDGQTTLNDDELMETRTLLMHQVISTPDDDEALALYKKNGGSKSSFYEWKELKSGSGVVKGSDRLQTGNVEFESSGSLRCILYAIFADNVTPAYIIKNYEGVTPGDYSSPSAPITTSERGAFHLSSTTYADKPYSVAEWRCSESQWDGKDQSTIVWGPWHAVDDSYLTSSGMYKFPSPSSNFDVTKENVFELRYARRSYDVTYYSNGKAVGTSQYRYGQEFTAGDGIDTSALASPDGLVFAGWAVSPDATEPVSGSITMPGGNYSLYALWKHAGVHVTFDSAGGTPVDAQTVAWEGKAVEPATPTREGYEFGGWYYFGAGSETPARFSFDMPLEADAHLVAAWRSTNTPTTYTVRHVAADGTVLAEQKFAGTVGQTASALALAKDDALRRGYAYVDKSGAALDLAGDAAKNVITFTYENDAQRSYVVHMLDKATGLPVAVDVEFDSPEALVNYQAPQLQGYHVLDGGQGYLSARDGGQELTFWYEKNAEPAQPDNPYSPDQPGNPANAGDGAVPSDGAAVSAGGLGAPTTAASAPAFEQVAAKTAPQTGDATSAAVPLGFGAVGAALAALSLRMRRRASRR
jgi:uncharacterized repeat protein (TIGR02543 family)